MSNRGVVGWALAGVAGAALTGCLDELGIGSDSENLHVVEIHEKQYAWTTPTRCDLFLHRRAYDERTRVAEYSAQVGARELSVTYSVDETSPLPLGIDIAETGILLAALRASADELEVTTADGDLALRVRGYTGGPGIVETGVPLALGADVLALLACVLPMRADLGYVPGFIRNRRDVLSPGNDTVAGSSSAEQALLEDWDAEVSLLGAWVRQGLCLGEDQGVLAWRCGCFILNDELTGPVSGDCGGSFVNRSITQ